MRLGKCFYLRSLYKILSVCSACIFYKKFSVIYIVAGNHKGALSALQCTFTSSSQGYNIKSSLSFLSMSLSAALKQETTLLLLAKLNCLDLNLCPELYVCIYGLIIFTDKHTLSQNCNRPSKDKCQTVEKELRRAGLFPN